MSGQDDTVKVSEASLEKLKELNECLHSNESKALEILKYLLDDIREDFDPELRLALEETRVKCWISLEQFDKVTSYYTNVVIAHERNDATIAYPSKVYNAYALYRLEKYAEAKEQLDAIVDTADDDNRKIDVIANHLLAQCMYNLPGQSDAAQTLDQYEKLLTNSEASDDKVQICTNMAAVLASHSVPYVSTGSQTQHVEKLQEMLHESEDDVPYDLAYNMATYHLTGQSTREWQQWLQRAKKACDTAEDADDHEQFIMAHNAEWSQALWSGTSMDTSILNNSTSQKSFPMNTKLVIMHNKALGMPPTSSLKLLPSSLIKGTPLQNKILLYNRAAVAFAAKKYDVCSDACDALVKAVKSSSSSNNKKNKTVSTDNISKLSFCISEEESLWWQSRAAVVKAYCLQSLQKEEAALTNLQSVKSAVESKQPSPLIDSALGYLQLHEFALTNKTDAVALLTNLPASWKNSRAVLASLASLYQQQGKNDKADQVLRETGDDQVFADYAMANGDYEKAAGLYEKAYNASSENELDLARWIQALSHVYPERARELWENAAIVVDDDDDDDLDTLGAQLEGKDTSRLASTSRSDVSTVNGMIQSNDTGKKKKSHEAVLRQRAKRREAYIEKLKEKDLYDPNRPVDPERWLPKYERSYSRRRRNNRHKGAQGGVSEKDAAKFDVVARKNAPVVEDSKSTAHLTVQGGNRRGGRRR